MIYKHPVDILSELGAEWLDWEPETIELTFELSGKPIHLDKLLALQTLVKNPNPVARQSFVFEKICIAFCNGFTIMDTYVRPYIEEVFYAVGQMQKIVPDIEFSGDVPNYLAAVAKSRDWIVLPDRLAWAQEALNGLTGLSEGSRRYKDHLEALEALKRAVSALNHIEFKTLLSSKELDGMEGHVITRYIGAYLYDPTVKE